MKKILLQVKNDRNKETRISTNKDNLEIEVFFQNHEKQIKKGKIVLFQGGGDLTVCLLGAGKQQTHFLSGNLSEKLPLKS